MPETCDRILEEFFFQPLDDGCRLEDTPLCRAYREEIDLIEQHDLAQRYGVSRSDLMWALIQAFAEVIP
jgi:hypothetical protein